MKSGTQKQPDFFSLQIAKARRFHMDLMPPRNKELVVVSGGCEHCTADYEIHRAGFPYFGLEFVAHGRGTLRLDGKAYELQAGTLFAYGPRTAQDIVSDPVEKLVKYFVDFSGKKAAASLRLHGPAPGEAVQTSAPAEVMNIFDDLISNGLRNTPFSGRIAVLQLDHLLLKIDETKIPFGSSATPAFASYRRCRQWIEDHPLELKTLGQIASECHIDPAYLCRLFRRFDHQSPYQYLLRLKMGRAANRLQTAGTTVKQVADEMGFSDPFHFSRLFKKTIGLPPAKFVRHIQRA